MKKEKQKKNPLSSISKKHWNKYIQDYNRYQEYIRQEKSKITIEVIKNKTVDYRLLNDFKNHLNSIIFSIKYWKRTFYTHQREVEQPKLNANDSEG